MNNSEDFLGSSSGGGGPSGLLKLTYFDFHGGRGEPARIALSMGGIPFEDERVKGTDWERRKPDTPFGALPLLEKDGDFFSIHSAISFSDHATRHGPS